MRRFGITDAEFDALIAAIYDAGLEFGRWPDALRRLAHAFDCVSAGMAQQGRTPADCWALAPMLEPAYVDRYVRHYHSINPVWQRVPSTPTGTVQTDTMVIPRRELERTEFYNDFLRTFGTEGMLNAVALFENGRQTVVTVHGSRTFEPEHVRFYQRLAPHIERAVRLNRKLAGLELRSDRFAAALDSLVQGVLLVDADARVLFANRAAESLFRPGQGLRLNKGALCAGSAAQSQRLHGLIASCVAPELGAARGGLLCIARPEGKPLSLLVAPLGSAEAPLQPEPAAVAMIFVTVSGETFTPRAEQFRTLFNLTNAEAAFAGEILQGDGINAAAERLSISRSTARTHLSRLFEKTGTRRQAELVRVLMQVNLQLRA